MSLKLAIRNDEKAGVIRAYFSTIDDEWRDEVATLDRRLAEKIPDLFEKWTALLTAALAVAIKAATGAEVTGFEVFRPGDKN